MSPIAAKSRALKAGRFDWDVFMARADAGLPEPGIYRCAWCGREDCLMFTRRVEAEPDKRKRSHRRVSGQFPAGDVVGELWCPCCSVNSPMHGKCTHVPSYCPVCGLCTNPTSFFASGGPFTRCDGAESHARARA